MTKIERWLPILAVCMALSLTGCSSHSEPPRPEPPQEPAEPPRPPGPTITLGAEAFTHAVDNPNHWLEVDVTVANTTGEEVPFDWERMIAISGCTMVTPSWSIERRPPTLSPGSRFVGRVSWSCYPTPPEFPISTTVTVRHFHGQTETFHQTLPVRALPIDEIELRLDPPAQARSYVEPVPDSGEGWDVCVHGVATNGTEEPRIYLPNVAAAVVAPAGAHGAASGLLGGRATRLDPGAAVSGQVCWRFRGSGPAPTRIRVERDATPGGPQEIDVAPPG